MLSRSICSLCCSTSSIIHKCAKTYKSSIQTVVKFKAIYYDTCITDIISSHYPSSSKFHKAINFMYNPSAQKSQMVSARKLMYVDFKIFGFVQK